MLSKRLGLIPQTSVTSLNSAHRRDILLWLNFRLAFNEQYSLVNCVPQQVKAEHGEPQDGDRYHR